MITTQHQRRFTRGFRYVIPANHPHPHTHANDRAQQANQKEKLDALNEEDAEEELEEAEETEAQAQIAEAEEEDELSEDEVSEDESMGYDGPSMVM